MVTYDVFVTFSEATLNLQEYLISGSFTNGGFVTLPFGELKSDCSGNLLLDNEGSQFDAYNPAAGIELGPGPRVRIFVTEPTLDQIEVFSGFSDGIVPQVLTDGRKVAIMRIIGPIPRLIRYHEGIYTSIEGTLRADRAVSLVLNSLGWPSSRQNLALSDVHLSGKLLRDQGILGQDGQYRVPVQTSLASIAKGDGGRIYSTRHGYIRFENRNFRHGRLQNLQPLAPWYHVIDNAAASPSDVIEAVVPPGSPRVVNILNSEGTRYGSAGINTTVPVIPSLLVGTPRTYKILPKSKASFIFRVEQNVGDPGSLAANRFVNRWNTPTRPENYSYDGLTSEISFTTLPDQLHFVVDNQSGALRTLIVKPALWRCLPVDGAGFYSPSQPGEHQHLRT